MKSEAITSDQLYAKSDSRNENNFANSIFEIDRKSVV